MDIKPRTINQQESIDLDAELFDEYGYSIYQLMELAGLNVAQAITKCYPVSDPNNKVPIVCCGPGNNGGDGLVVARHLKLFGYSPIVIYPSEKKIETYMKLLTLCRNFDIEILSSTPEEPLNTMGNFVVDCVFGYSYTSPNRSLIFAGLLKKMGESCRCYNDDDDNNNNNNNINNNQDKQVIPLISVDVPSGWHVEKGPGVVATEQAKIDESLKIPILKPDCLISLMSPKTCSKSFEGQFHYVAGRFCPDKLAQKYKLALPNFANGDGIYLLSRKVPDPTMGNNAVLVAARNLIAKFKSIRA